MLLRLTAPPPPLSPSAGGRAFSSAFSSSQRAHQHSRGLLVASSSGGYRKVPLETEGAYRLIDDDTGDSVILWGDQNLPSDHLLFPSSHSPPPSQTSSSSSFKSSFGKLKAHKVKALLDRRNAHSHQRQSSPHAADSQDDYRIRRKRYDDDDGEEEEESGEEQALARGGSTHVHPSTSSSMKRGWGADTRTNSFRPKQQQQRTRGSSVEIDRGFFSRKSFKDLGCTDYIIEALRNQLFLRPSHIQALSYAPILEGKSCIVADQSGSGKTLAYLTPVIQCLRQDELLGIAKSTPKNPRVVILVPTAELASQVLSNCRSLANQGVPFRSIVATGGFRQKTQLESLQQELDVLIATPGRFIYLLKEGYLELTNLKSVVLDEVDVLYSDDGFEDVLKNLMLRAPIATQYIFVTATLPIDIYNRLVEVFPDCEVVMGPGMHRTSSGLEEVLVDCSGDGEEKNPDTAFLNKKSALLRIVEESLGGKTIVFCNKIETCRKVENALKRYDRKGERIQVLPFHSALEPELRLSNMKEFLKSKTKDPLFLVCTDRASRGIDFKAVDQVVLFDLPRDPSEYVRRVGRVARGAGGKGKAFVFAVGKQVSLARRIIERNLKGHPLHSVPC